MLQIYNDQKRTFNAVYLYHIIMTNFFEKLLRNHNVSGV